ncbi:amino acid adenylation domain-containing protein, partial [Steroidobacter sp. S1-65]
FEEQVKLVSERTAVLHEGQSLTYEELNCKANQLARYLVRKGIGPDQLVAICIERSVEMVVGLLGILKAGAAYIPLDPNYPIERLQYMLEDAAPEVVLVQAKLKSTLPITRAEMIALDERWDEIAGYADSDLSPAELEVSASSLVYVIYTSGSTGRPKGTTMTHRSMGNLIEWHRRTYRAQPGQRVLQFAALSFDVAFQEIFSTLCTGGTLVLLNDEVRRDARALAELLRSQSIERLFVPPLMLQSLAEHCQATDIVPESLRDVITAGEQLRISPEISSFFKRLQGCRLHNHYGPTETHVVTALSLPEDAGEWPSLPSIGQPISNTQIYILDRQRQLAPIGVTGEIYIGGANVARGYLRRPALTAERFIADPFNEEPPSRMYQTGDLGRWRTDGSIEYLGRNDAQVKIRGFRVELAEIEAQLLRHSRVREAAALVREDSPGEKRLVAYVSPRANSSLNVEELRAHLQATLPDYMVPSAFVILQSFPLTPSGKLDRRALPAPQVEAYASEEYEAPQGEIEQTLARIWQELLQLERVGRQDNFFELGGHSLLATRAVTQINRLLDVDIKLRHVFEKPTIRRLAEIILQKIADQMSEEV